MPVPSPSAPAVVNTTGGAFVAQNQGGTLLGNGTTGSVITKAFLLKDAVDAETKVPFPVVLSNGLYGTQKAFASGTFAYFEAGKYVIKTISDTISGVASNLVLSPASYSAGSRSIMDFQNDFGATIASRFRNGRYSYTGYSSHADTKFAVRSAALFTNADGDAIEAPATLTGTNMFDLTDGDAADKAVDRAATPTLAVPGQLVMKVDFVDLDPATGGDYFDYKPITG